MNLSQEEWAEQIESDKNAIVLDVRTPPETQAGRIPNAHIIDILKGEDYFASEAKNLDKTKSYYVYCRSGKRSAKACEIMQQIGFESVYNLEGGFEAWYGDSVSG